VRETAPPCKDTRRTLTWTCSHFSPTRRRTASAGFWRGRLLTPLILLAGIVAVVALTAIGIGRHHGQRKPARRPAAARALVLRLEPVPVETGLAGAGRRAA
jgi:hypothetical protein